MEEESPSAQTVQLCEMQHGGTLKRGGTPPTACPAPNRQAICVAGTAQSVSASVMMQEDLTTRSPPSALPSQHKIEGLIDDEFDDAG